MESKDLLYPVKDLCSPPNHKELLLQHSLLFADGLKELRNVKEQLYAAAEHFEDSYKKNDHKPMLLESLKEYVSKSLIKTIDHLGSVTCKVNKFLDENVNEVSRTNLRVLYIEQRLQTCQAFAKHIGMSQQSLMMQTPKYHKRYPVQEDCISEIVKAEKEKPQSSCLRKGYPGQASTKFPKDMIAFSFSKAASHKRLEKRSRSVSPIRFRSKRSGSAANQSTCPGLSVKLSASSIHRSISPNLSSSRRQQSPESWKSHSQYPQRENTKDREVYSTKTRNLFKALLDIYKSKNNKQHYR